MIPLVTPLYAGLLALLYVVLAMRTAAYRGTAKADLGDGGDPEMLVRIRAHGNASEYVPLGIVLLLLCELIGAPGIALHALGLMLLIGRALHAAGFWTAPPTMALRVAGILLTVGMIGLAALGLIGHTLF